MARSNSTAYAGLFFSLAVLACDDNIPTEQGQIRLQAPLQSFDAYAPSLDILERSRVCLRYTAYRVADNPPEFEDAEEEELRACYDERLTGPAAFDGECIVMNAPGPIQWEATRRACGIEGDFGDDQVVFEVVALANVRGAFAYAVPGPASIEGFDIQGPAGPSGGPVAAVGEPVYVIEDLLEAVSSRVVRGDAPISVAVTDGASRGVVVDGSPTFDAPEDPTLRLGVHARAGDVFDVVLDLPAGQVEVGQVNVVSRTEIASMTLEPAVVRVTGTDQFLLLGAAAVTLDRDGRVLREPPVTWSVVQGEVEVETPADAPEGAAPAPSPSVNLVGACEGAAPGEHQSAVVRGSIDGLVETTRLEWDCVGTPDEGCACRSNPGAPRPAWMLGLVVLAALRRRSFQGITGPVSVFSFGRVADLPARRLSKSARGNQGLSSSSRR